MAAYRALVDLFPQPAELALFNAQMRRLGYDPADRSTDPATPSGIGNLAAQALLAFRHTDGSNQLGDLNPGAYSDYTGYAPINTAAQINDPNRWQPITFADGRTPGFVTPHWGFVEPFAFPPGDARPHTPAVYPDDVGFVEYVAGYLASVYPGLKSDATICGVFPITIVTARVSPSARPRPRMTAPNKPFFA